LVYNRRLNRPRLSNCLSSVGKKFHTRGPAGSNHGKTPVAVAVYVGWRRSQSQTNGVDADGRRRRVDGHLPSTTVPGRLDAGRPVYSDVLI